MQKLVLSLIAGLLLAACGNSVTSKSGSAVKEYTVHVWGNCEKCKATIEKACKINGVSKADWGIESKLLSLKLDTTEVTLNTVLNEVARAGYDTESTVADDYAYGSLPQCCQYERRSDTK